MVNFASPDARTAGNGVVLPPAVRAAMAPAGATDEHTAFILAADGAASPPDRESSTSTGDTNPHPVVVMALSINDSQPPPPFTTDLTPRLVVSSSVSGLSSDRARSPDESSDDGAPLLAGGPSSAEQPPVRRYAIFTMLPLFMGYATLVTLQGEVKASLGIADGANAASFEFSFATSLLYLGNLIFRLMHNVLFCWCSPRIRVCIAYGAIALATGLLGTCYFALNSKSMVPVYIAYSLGGVAVGTFESNLISTITPLGHQTKAWAQYGITFGFNGISIGAFLLFTAVPHVLALRTFVYFFVAASNVAGIFFFLLAIPNIRYEASAQSLKLFWSDTKSVREWGCRIAPHSICLMLDMLAVGCMSALQIYIYDVGQIPLWWHASTSQVIPENAFRTVFNLCSMLGDGVGRKLAYTLRCLHHPAWFLLCTAAGAALIMSKIAVVAPLGQFLVMFATGAIYATTTRHIDTNVDKRYNLIALSVWLFLGDVGSFSGANAVNALRVAIGSVGSVTGG